MITLSIRLRHPKFDDITILIDQLNQEILGYLSLKASHIPITSELLGKVPAERSLRFIMNSVESGVEICTPQMFELLARAFDYRHLRPDIISGLTTAEVGVGTTAEIGLGTERVIS